MARHRDRATKDSNKHGSTASVAFLTGWSFGALVEGQGPGTIGQDYSPAKKWLE